MKYADLTLSVAPRCFLLRELQLCPHSVPSGQHIFIRQPFSTHALARASDRGQTSQPLFPLTLMSHTEVTRQFTVFGPYCPGAVGHHVGWFWFSSAQKLSAVTFSAFPCPVLGRWEGEGQTQPDSSYISHFPSPHSRPEGRSKNLCLLLSSPFQIFLVIVLTRWWPLTCGPGNVVSLLSLWTSPVTIGALNWPLG